MVVRLQEKYYAKREKAKEGKKKEDEEAEGKGKCVGRETTK